VHSTRELALASVTNAIDELDARRADADPADLAARVAAVWALVAELDPELAKSAARYTSVC
jgi:hypothetical protein